jgi:hypothetical protein
VLYAVGTLEGTKAVVFGRLRSLFRRVRWFDTQTSFDLLELGLLLDPIGIPEDLQIHFLEQLVGAGN